jgi:hypothetical protein
MTLYILFYLDSCFFNVYVNGTAYSLYAEVIKLNNQASEANKDADVANTETMTVDLLPAEC